MPNLSRKIVILLLSAWVCVAARGAQNQPSPALGQIVSASAASIGGVTVPSGGTLASGDTLSTSAGGAALVRFSMTNQVELAANTAATFSGTPDHVLVKISQGALVATAAGPDAVVTETSQCRIQAQGPEGASYAIDASAGTGAAVTARQGTVSVTEIDSGQRRVLAQGETVNCALLAVPGQEQAVKPSAGEASGQAAPSPAAAHNHTGLLLLILGGGAAAGVGVALAGHGGGSGTPVSPSGP